MFHRPENYSVHTSQQWEAFIDQAPTQFEIWMGKPTGDAVIDATARCVEQNGLDQVTIDEVARMAGVSRATIYRRYGSREALFLALMQHAAKPYIERCTAIAQGSGSLKDRIQQIIVASIDSIDGLPWFRTMLLRGISERGFELLRISHKSVAAGIVRPMLESAESAGDWRAPDDLDRLMDWLLREILSLGAERLEIDEIDRRVGIYVMPILRLDEMRGEQDGLAERLARLERILVGQGDAG